MPNNIMLNSDTTKKIEEFVYSKPRSTQEIASHIRKNWRTADRYVSEIKKNFGTIDTRTFREGTRGALKIVFWASVEKISSSIFQEILEKDIFQAKKKEEFSPFDIFQHIPDKNKTSLVEQTNAEHQTDLNEYINLIKNTQKQLLIFSGNLSFINIDAVSKVLEELVKRNISIKVVSRVDLEGKENIEKLLSLNLKHGKEQIEVRHREQPLRALITDGKILRIKEIKQPTGKKHELDKETHLFYTIKDKDWIDWTSKIFWKMFSLSVNANKRLQELNKL